MNKKRTSSAAVLVRAAVVAALYVALTVTPPLSSLSFGVLQVRVSEALCVLPFLFPETAAGLILGCLISNFFSPLILPLDLVLGTAATALAVLATLLLRKTCSGKLRYLAPLPTVLSNALIVPVILCLSTPGESFATLYFSAALSVGLGELLSAYGLGLPLYFVLKKFCPAPSNQKEEVK